MSLFILMFSIKYTKINPKSLFVKLKKSNNKNGIKNNLSIKFIII
jgi:hypothetical protein